MGTSGAAGADHDLVAGYRAGDAAHVRRWHRADRNLVRVDDMYHQYFTALGFVAAVDTALHVGPPVASLGTKVGGVVQMTGAFLDGVLRRGAATPALPRANVPPFSTEHLAIGQ